MSTQEKIKLLHVLLYQSNAASVSTTAKGAATKSNAPGTNKKRALAIVVVRRSGQ